MNAAKQLRTLESYVLVGLRKNGPPVCWFDTAACSNDQDVRHQFLKHTKNTAVNGVDELMAFAKKNKEALDQEIRAAHHKEQRSAALAAELKE